MKLLFRIGQLLDAIQGGQVESHLAVRTIGRAAQRWLVEEEPGLLHAHRNHAHRRRGRVEPVERGADLLEPMLTRLALGIAVHEQQITRIELDGRLDALVQRLGWRRKLAQIGPFQLRLYLSLFQ